ncbi:MAG: aspartyl/asparaginyl beta-hydroxylase domain-containing protein [Bdellovibrionales bacterium]|jgi:hypothetical protein|nr:aspartyl/asparaginyl beta-hydroxylase domain-containing protein [Bdellovibrionales bacterium]
MKLGTDNNPEFSDYLYAPNTEWRKPSRLWMKLPDRYSFDPEEARREYEKLEKRFPMRPFQVESRHGISKPRLSYRGIGLTSRPQAENPVYDALNLYGPKDQKLSIFKTFEKVSELKEPKERVIEVLDESGFSEKTDACGPYFDALINRFRSPFTKVRFLELMPGGVIPPHVDFPFYQGIRVHACLTSNEDVVWEVEGEQFRIPCDGHFYWFDTGRYHAVRNDGDTSRVVFSVNLSPFFGRDGSRIEVPTTDLIELMSRGEV